jgi:hypothetical protein
VCFCFRVVEAVPCDKTVAAYVFVDVNAKHEETPLLGACDFVGESGVCDDCRRSRGQDIQCLVDPDVYVYLCSCGNTEGLEESADGWCAGARVTSSVQLGAPSEEDHAPSGGAWRRATWFVVAMAEYRCRILNCIVCLTGLVSVST